MTYFAKQLKKILIEKNWTQTQLADFLGKPFTQSLISLYLNGKHTPSQRNMFLMADRLQIPRSYFLEPNLDFEGGDKGDYVRIQRKMQLAEVLDDVEQIIDNTIYELTIPALSGHEKKQICAAICAALKAATE